MNDALIAIIVVIVAVIPVAGVIHYAYSSIVSSREISERFNEFNYEVEQRIWDHMNNPGTPIAGSEPFPVSITANGETITANRVVFHSKTLDAGRRHVPVKVYILKRP